MLPDRPEKIKGGAVKERASCAGTASPCTGHLPLFQLVRLLRGRALALVRSQFPLSAALTGFGAGPLGGGTLPEWLIGGRLLRDDDAT